MKKYFTLVILSGFFSNVYALNSGACTSLVYGHGWFRSYPALGIGETGINNLTKTTSKGSTIKGTTNASAQSSTASTDPGVSTRMTQSQTQSTSSWGACSAFASSQELRQLRDLYYVQNKDEFLKELAQGNGQHLEVMAFLGRCDQSRQKLFNATMQSHYSDLILESQDDQKFMNKFDAHLEKDLNCKLHQNA